jgi:hypothetical protein
MTRFAIPPLLVGQATLELALFRGRKGFDRLEQLLDARSSR